MDYDDYVNKMLTVLGDGEKFVQLGPDVTHDKIKALELKFQKCFLKLVKNKDIFLDIYEAIRTVVSMQSQLYTLLKPHKDND